MTGRTWQELVSPAPRPTGKASNNPAHPSHKHNQHPRPVAVLTLAADVKSSPYIGALDRRARRTLNRALDTARAAWDRDR